MLLKIGAAVAALPLAAAGLVAGTGVAVVDVRPSDGPRVVVPVPLVLMQAAASFVPPAKTEHAFRGLDRAQRYLPVAEEVIAALSEAPDCELVRVEDGREQVRIDKVGGVLEIRVRDGRETVSVNVPLAMVQQVLAEAHHGRRLNAADLVSTLRHARLTQLVDVQSPDAHVNISIW